MKNVTFTISCTVPVPAASSLGGNNSNKGLSKVDRENRYFLNALIRRGAVLISEVEVGKEVAAPAAAPVAAAKK